MTGAVLGEPWATILAEEFQAQMVQNTETPAKIPWAEVRK